MSSETMHVPVTKGGFSNDGSAVLSREVKCQDDSHQTFSLTSDIELPLYIAAKYHLRYYQRLQNDSTLANSLVSFSMSSSLWSSNLTLSQYYDVSAIVAFIAEHKAHRVAIQFPDTLISDAPALVELIEYLCRHLPHLQSLHPNHTSTPASNSPLSVYVLGDTSYGACCIDQVAAQHINADVLVHVGFACMSPTVGVPVLHCFGNHTLVQNSSGVRGVAMSSKQPTLTDYSSFDYGCELVHSTLTSGSDTLNVDLSLNPVLLSIVRSVASSTASNCSLFPRAEDEDEYDDADDEDDEPSLLSSSSHPTSSTATKMIAHPKRCLLVLYDRCFLKHVPVMVAAMRACGLFVYTTEQLHLASSNVTISNAPSLCSTAAVVVADCETVTGSDQGDTLSKQGIFTVDQGVSVHSLRGGALPPLANSTTSPDTVLAFAGFSWPVHPLPLQQLEHPLPNSFLCDYTDHSGSVQSSGNSCENKPDQKLIAANKIWSAYFNPKHWTILFLSGAQSQKPVLVTDDTNIPATHLHCSSHSLHSSILLSSHFTLNFPMHTIVTMNVPTINQTYLVNPHTAKNDDVTSIPTVEIQTTLISGTRDTSRLMSRRFYMVEKAKNANIFGIVVCTLVAKQYMRVISKIQQLIKDAGKKSYLLIVGKVNEPKLLNFPDIECFVMVSCPMSVLLQSYSNVSSVDVISAVECELALGDNRVWNGLYSTDFTDIFPKTGRLGQGPLSSDDKALLMSQIEESQSSNTAIVEHTEDDDETPTEVNDEEPRFSIVDGRYHTTYKKSNNAQQEDTKEPDAIVYGLVEVGASALVDAGYKPYQRTYTGLDANYEVSDVNMKIQPGLYGTARQYTTMKMMDGVDDDHKKF